MTCYHPFTGIRFGKTGSIQVFPHGYRPQNLKKPFEMIPLPCGHCIGCRLDRSRKWADRLMCELTQHDQACFLTLTYNDECLPPKNSYIGYNGELLPSPYNPLVKEHVQLFIKRLRKRTNKKIRYFAVGEYGEKNHRPHYHIILFGYDFSDCRNFKFLDDNKHIHYVSSFLYDGKPEKESESLWKYGICDIASVSWQSCAYVSRYITKKLFGDMAEAQYEALNYPPEFCLMSKRPGIGSEYFKEKMDDYKLGKIVIPTENGALDIGSNRYFDELFKIERPDEYKELKRSRAERSKNFEKARLEKSELDYESQLAVDEKAKIRQCSVLKRSIE